MKGRFLSAAVLAFLYASPVLGAALANPYPRAQEEVQVSSPDGEVVDVSSQEAPPEAPKEPTADENQPQPPSEEKKEEPPKEESQEPAKQGQAENSPAGAPPAANALSADQAIAGTAIANIEGIVEPLLQGGESALVKATEPGADAEDTSKAVVEGANAQANLEQQSNSVAIAIDQVAKSTDIFEMEITFQGPRGKLVSNIGKLPQTNGRLDNLNVCKDATMTWVDDTKRDEISLSMGKTQALGTDALAYSDPECQQRIDEGPIWPPEDVKFVAGDHVTFYYKLLGLTERQLFGLDPLADGKTYLPKLDIDPEVSNSSNETPA